MDDNDIENFLLNGDSDSEIEDNLEVQDYDSDDNVADPTYLIPNQQENELSSITTLVTYQLDEVSTLQEPSTSKSRPHQLFHDPILQLQIRLQNLSSFFLLHHLSEGRIITYGQPRALIDQDQIELPQEM